MTKKILGVCALALMVSCAGVHVVPQPEAVTRLTATDQPLPPFDPPVEEAESMNTEYCLGSCAAEQARFKDFSDQIVALQNKQTTERKQPMQRGFHGKAHGCVQGTLTLSAKRDARTKFGVFSEQYSTWPIVARFSNGVGWTQADDELDHRGMAIKLLGVEGPHLMNDETTTQDFLMTNTPTPVGRNAEEFMKFAHQNEAGRVSGVGFLISHPNTAAPALSRTGAVDSAVTLQYWAGGAFHLGAHQAVKYSMKPCEGAPKRTPIERKDENYLRQDLMQAAKEGFCYSLYVQFQVAPDVTPIEHASREWKEADAPLVHLGDISFPSQALGEDEMCKQLSFNPWHALVAQQPMGHINRARRAVYDASREHRKGGSAPVAPATAP